MFQKKINEDLIRLLKEKVKDELTPSKENKQSGILNSNDLEGFEELTESSLDDVVLNLQNNKYKIFSNSKIDNILILYKILNNKIHFVKISKNSIYYHRKYEDSSEKFSVYNYFIPINEINEICFYSKSLYIKCNNKLEFSIYFFHDYLSSTEEDMTKEEKQILENEIINAKLKVQMLTNDIFKKNNSVSINAI